MTEFEIAIGCITTEYRRAVARAKYLEAELVATDAEVERLRAELAKFKRLAADHERDSG